MQKKLTRSCRQQSLKHTNSIKKPLPFFSVHCEKLTAPEPAASHSSATSSPANQRPQRRARDARVATVGAHAKIVARGRPASAPSAPLSLLNIIIASP